MSWRDEFKLITYGIPGDPGFERRWRDRLEADRVAEHVCIGCGGPASYTLHHGESIVGWICTACVPVNFRPTHDYRALRPMPDLKLTCNADGSFQFQGLNGRGVLIDKRIEP